MKVALVALLVLAGCATSDVRTRCIDNGGRAVYDVVDTTVLMVQCAGWRENGEGRDG